MLMRQAWSPGVSGIDAALFDRKLPHGKWQRLEAHLRAIAGRPVKVTPLTGRWRANTWMCEWPGETENNPDGDNQNEYSNQH
jgi:hypothetical protein